MVTRGTWPTSWESGSCRFLNAVDLNSWQVTVTKFWRLWLHHNLKYIMPVSGDLPHWEQHVLAVQQCIGVRQTLSLWKLPPSRFAQGCSESWWRCNLIECSVFVQLENHHTKYFKVLLTRCKRMFQNDGCCTCTSCVVQIGKCACDRYTTVGQACCLPERQDTHALHGSLHASTASN